MFHLSGPDNGTWMWGSDDHLHHSAPELQVCATCGYKTYYPVVRTDYCIETDFDFSHTYDGYPICSTRFEEQILGHGVEQDCFLPLPGARGFSCLIPVRCFFFDTQRRKTRFFDYCSSCGTWGSVAGATPIFFKIDPASGISRSDVMFGSGNSQSPIIICDTEIADSIKDLKGVELEPVPA